MLSEGALSVVLTLAAASWVVGCASSIVHLRPKSEFPVIPCDRGAGSSKIEIQYLGSGGFLLRRGEHSILTAPFYSNPGLIPVALGFSVTNERGRRAVTELPVSDVRAVLVGQAHYDHLADVPFLVPNLPEETKIYGSRTAAYLLHAAGVSKKRTEELNTIAGNWRRPGTWTYVADDGIRFMALHSEHAPHFLGIKMFTGKLSEQPECRPRSAYDWVEGQTFAFVIDFLAADGSIEFRVHYQDSASNPPYGFHPPFPPDDQRRVDAAILCVASFAQVKEYPEGIVRDLAPRHVVLAHWESFFRPQSKSLKAVALLDTKEFATRLQSALPANAEWLTPKPGAKVRFDVCREEN